MCAYFANGTEGTDYELRYCERCVHQKPDDGGCAVWLAHLLHNGAEGDLGGVLDMLIPRSKDGLWNDECALFHPAQPREPESPRLFPW